MSEELDFAASEEGEFVVVKAGVHKLKATTNLFRQKTDKDKAKNFMIENPVFQERRFSIVVTGKDDMTGKNYRLNVPLKHSIDTSGCYIETADGFIHIYLKKADPSQSWESEVRNGLVYNG